MRYSSRTRPVPWFTILAIAPRRGDEPALRAGHRRYIRREEHRDRRLVDADEWQRLGRLGVGHRLADLDRVDAGDRDELARARLRDLDPLEPFVAVEHGDLRVLDGAVPVDDRDLF